MEKFKCSIKGCERERNGRLYCPMHLKRLKVHGDVGLAEPLKSQHRMSTHPLYHTWENMRARCNKPTHTNYHLYGGRGIKICDRWSNFAYFVDDIGPKPSPKYSLDRINPNGDYEPGNIRWATQTTQLRNQVLRSANKTGFRGVFYDRKFKTYRVAIKSNYKHYNLGSYKSLDEAIQARISGEVDYWVDGNVS